MFPGETVLSQKAMGIEPNKHVTPLKVIKSNDYYIGTMFVSCGDQSCKDCGEAEYPRANYEAGRELDYNSRETEYFATKEEADKALEEFNKTEVLAKQRGL